VPCAWLLSGDLEVWRLRLRRNNSLHPGYLTSLVTRTNHNTIQTIGVYV